MRANKKGLFTIFITKKDCLQSHNKEGLFSIFITKKDCLQSHKKDGLFTTFITKKDCSHSLHPQRNIEFIYITDKKTLVIFIGE